MALFPAYCPSCRAVFAVRNIVEAPPGVKFTFYGNVTNCPECGKDARLVDGEFQIEEDSLKLIAGPPRSAALLSAFAALVNEAIKTRDIDKLEKDADKLDPKLGDVVRVAKSKHSAGVVILFVLILMLKGCNLEVKLDINQLVEYLISESDMKDAESEKGAAHAEASGKGPSNKNTEFGH